MIDKGFVSTVLDGGKRVTVVPAFSGSAVSIPLSVPSYLTGTMKINKEVVYCMFPDSTGIVIASMDGTWNNEVDAGEVE